MSVWTAPSPSDIDRAAQRIADGVEISEACRQEGFTLTRLRQTDRQAWVELRQLWHDVQGVEDRTTARDTLRTVATKTDAEDKDRVAAAVQLGKASGYLTEQTHVEISGGMEVTSPDVTAAIEQFTARVLSLATGTGPDSAGGDVAGLGESGAGVPVAELDRTAVAEPTSG